MAKSKTSNKKNVPDIRGFLTVGIGASAGGVKALREFFAVMPSDSGMAFVVIMHLSQTDKSSLAEILQRETKMKVEQVQESVKVEPNKVYVIPPARHLEMLDGVIKVKTPQRIKGARIAIDRFFRTLAEACGRKAICIILSGTGSDGTLGMKHIKDRGGFAIIQDPKDAEYDGMPRNAIETKMADIVLPVAEMPEKLLFVRDTTEKFRLTDGDDGVVGMEIKHIEILRDVLTLLRVRTGHDFSNYKRSTLIRRLARHLQIYETDDLEKYLEILRKKPDEVLSLQKNLLINVTNFFRDKEAFEALEKKVIPQLYSEKKAREQIRVWIEGCSTGEEAYSIAMLWSEYAATLTNPPKIQIFASDVDEDAIAEAREGNFTEAVVSDVSPERLQKFFAKEKDGTYRIRKQIREMILFAPHNVLRDPPFSRLDLVSCRNMLIYLNRETQEKVLHIFRFALREKGYLFLGSSETADNLPRDFSPVDKKHRIYQCRPSETAWNAPPALPVQSAWLPKISGIPAKARYLQSFGELHHRLIEHYAPPSVLVNEEGSILHLSESAGRFLRFSGGEPSVNIMKVIRPALLSDVRTALFAAHKDNKPVEAKNIRVELDGTEKFVNVTVRPVSTPEAAALIIFEENGKPSDTKESVQAIIAGDKAMESVVRRMEDELKKTKDQLRNTIEQYETSTEELKASNEELQAVNEELRSASEELETSKEELQSVNEELTTVNHELKDKVDETNRVNSDLQNLILSTNIATIFLNHDLHIKRYTPTVVDIFNIIPTDIGRPLSDITHRLKPDNFQADAAVSLQTLQTSEREVYTAEGRFFIARFSPYRTLEDKIEGVVISFIDVTQREEAEQLVREERAYAEAIVDTLREPLIVLDKDLRVVSASRSFYETFKVTAEKTEGNFIYDLGNHQWDIPALRRLLEDILPQKSRFQNFEVEHEFESVGRRTMLLNGREIRRKGKGRRLILLTIFDVSEQRQAERLMEEERAYAEAIVETVREPLIVLDNDLRVVSASRSFYETFRVATGETEENFIYDLGNHQWDIPALRRVLEEILPEKNQFQNFEVSHEFETIGRRTMLLNAQEIRRNSEGRRLILLGIADITKQKQVIEDLRVSEESARVSEEKYRTLFNSIDQGFCIIQVLFNENGKTEDYRFLEVNPAFEQQTGLGDAIGRTMKELAPEHETFWFDTYGEIALTGKPIRFEHAAKALNSYYEVFAFRNGNPDEHRVAVLFNDITERKKAEKGQAFLLTLSDTLRSLTNPIEIKAIAAKFVAQHFGVRRACYAEVCADSDDVLIENDYADGIASIAGRWNMRSFGSHQEDVRAGRSILIPDTKADGQLSEPERKQWAAVGIRALAAAFTRRNGYVDNLFVAADTDPREWSLPEVRLLEEAAQRTQDALARGRAEEGLYESEENYRIIVNQAVAGIIKVDMSGHIIFANDRMAKMLDYLPEELLRLAIGDIVHEKDLSRHNEMFERLKNEGISYEIEKRLLRKNGSYIWVNNQISPIFDDEGNPQSAVIISIDITQQKNLEKQKDEFISVASHELKTPLTSIKGYGELLLDILTEDKQTQRIELMQKMNAQVNRLVKLVYGLLDTNRISAEKLTLQYETFDLNRLIEERVSEAQFTVPNHKLITKLGDIAPLRADRDRIGQVVTNLISNAVKYSPEANRIVISTVSINNEVKVCVRDFGIGLKPDEQQRIFERFYRVNTSSDVSGMGLGLYISMEIIKMHGGQIGVESPPSGRTGKQSKGTIFYFNLPYEPFKKDFK